MGRLRKRRFYVSDDLGSFYLVDADPARKAVVLPGPFEQGEPGDTRACTVSNFCMSNPRLFPHKVHGAQTIDSCVEIVDRKSVGNVPKHVVVYGVHSGIIGRNDKRALTKRDRETPITLHPYRIRNCDGRPQGASKWEPHEKQCLKGAKKRADAAKFPQL